MAFDNSSQTTPQEEDIGEASLFEKIKECQDRSTTTTCERSSM